MNILYIVRESFKREEKIKTKKERKEERRKGPLMPFRKVRGPVATARGTETRTGRKLQCCH
jgi:hypothetical protein